MPRLREETIGAGDQSWLGSMHAVVNARSGKLDRTAFVAETHYPDGHLPSGLPLVPTGTDDLYGPLTAAVAGTREVQTVTVTGAPTGGTFTLTYSGGTTAAIAFDASAETVESALEGLDGIEPGDVSVTGAAGGPYTVAFGDRENVPALTASGASLTGGTSPGVTIATPTPGVSGTGDGDLVFLLTDQSMVGTDAVINAPLLDHGRIRVNRLPVDFDPSGVAGAEHFTFQEG